MSRTYRKIPVNFCSNCDRPHIHTTAFVKGHPDYCTCDRNSYKWLYHSSYRKEVACHDRKPWYKPDKAFKQMRRQQFRAQCKQALYKHVYKDKDFIPPINKKGDVWDWN